MKTSNNRYKNTYLESSYFCVLYLFSYLNYKFTGLWQMCVLYNADHPDIQKHSLWKYPSLSPVTGGHGLGLGSLQMEFWIKCNW